MLVFTKINRINKINMNNFKNWIYCSVHNTKYYFIHHIFLLSHQKDKRTNQTIQKIS